MVSLAAVWLFACAWGAVPALLLWPLQSGIPAETVVPLNGRTAIVLLGGGTVRLPRRGGVEVPVLAYGRIVKALELYRSCQDRHARCVVLVSGGDPQRHGIAEASVYGALLRRLGVSPGELMLEGRSLNTWQNAEFSAPLLASYGADHILLVSSGVHVRRAVLYFSHFTTHITGVRADYEWPLRSLLPTGYNVALTDEALHEYAGIARYHVYQWLGWNGTGRAAALRNSARPLSSPQ